MGVRGFRCVCGGSGIGIESFVRYRGLRMCVNGLGWM